MKTKRKPVDQQAKYGRWWLGKRVRWPHEKTVKEVRQVEWIGQPSGVYGVVELHFTDGTRRMLCPLHKFKPCKYDLVVVAPTTKADT